VVDHPLDSLFPIAIVPEITYAEVLKVLSLIADYRGYFSELSGPQGTNLKGTFREEHSRHCKVEMLPQLLHFVGQCCHILLLYNLLTPAALGHNEVVPLGPQGNVESPFRPSGRETNVNPVAYKWGEVVMLAH
jgi:hypothetical protein